MTEITLIILGLGLTVAIGAVMHLGKRVGNVEDMTRFLKESAVAEVAEAAAHEHHHDHDIAASPLATLKAGDPLPGEIANLIPAEAWTLALAVDAECSFCRGTVEGWKALAEEASPAKTVIFTDVWPEDDIAWARLPDGVGVELGPGTLATIPTPAAAVIAPGSEVIAAGPVESSFELQMIVSQISELAGAAGGHGANGKAAGG